MRKLIVCSAVLLALAPAAFADDSAAEDAIGFPSRTGLAGFGDMVDARTPETLNIRGGLRYRFEIIERDFGSAVGLVRKEETHQLVFYGGVSLLGLVDVAAMIPHEWERTENDFSGFAPDNVDNDRGWGDLEAAAKVSIELGPIELAPYVRLKLPTAESAVEDLGEGEWGVAATFSILNEYLSVNGNIAGLNRETEGLTGITYRVGGSFVVWSDEIALVRIYGFGNGITFEGSPDTDLNVSFGVQARLLEFITLEIGSSVRLLDGGKIDEETEKDLIQQGVLEDHFDDEGTWDVHFGIGVMF